MMCVPVCVNEKACVGAPPWTDLYFVFFCCVHRNAESFLFWFDLGVSVSCREHDKEADVKVCLDGVWCWRQTQKNNKGLSVLVVLGWKSGSRKSPAERQSNCLINNVRKSSLCGFFGHEVGVSGRRQPQLKHHERWNSEMIVREIMSLVNVFYFVGPALSSSLLTFRCQFIRMEP